ncbi:MAG: hypothetical protein QM689_04720 [Oscillospiraceae bacterium]
MDRKFKTTSYGKILLRTLMAMVLTTITSLFYVFMKNAFGAGAGVVFGLCNFAIFAMLLADYTGKVAVKTAGAVRLRGWKPCPYFGLTLGLAAVSPALLSFLAVLAAKIGLLPNVMPVYNLLNMYFLPTLALAVKPDTHAEDLSAGALLLMVLLPLAAAGIAHIAYWAEYLKIDLKSKLMFTDKK